MDLKKIDFYLTSSEYEIIREPRACRVIGTIFDDMRRKFLFVEVSPSVSCTGNQEKILLFPRHEGNDLFNPIEYPIHVYVLTLKKELSLKDIIDSSNYENYVWGEVYLTKIEAIKKQL